MRGSGGAVTLRTRSSAITVAGPATVVAMALALALALDAPAVRMTAALVGCLVLPGLGWARRLRLRDLGDTIALTVVLSLSSTAVVATAMAVTGFWSPPAGLAGLAAITVIGFVPVRAVVAGAGVVLLGRPGIDGVRQPLAIEVDDTEDGWTDWYSDARARTDEEHRRRAAEAEAAEQDWRDWYAESRHAAALERSRRWDDADQPGAAAEPGSDDSVDPPIEDWSDWSALESTGGADAAPEDRVVRTGSA